MPDRGVPEEEKGRDKKKKHGCERDEETQAQDGVAGKKVEK